MMKIYRIVAQLSWALGLLSLVAALFAKVFVERVYVTHLPVEPRTMVLLACAFFLCTLATRETAGT